MRIWRRLLTFKRFAIFFALWLILSAADPEGVALGAAAAAAATLLSMRLMPSGQPAPDPFRLVGLLPHFVFRSLLGGLDVSRRALHPAMPLHPGWVSYPAQLPRGVSRFVLSSELSLFPGTLIPDADGKRLMVHCLDTRLPIAKELAAEEARLMKAMSNE